MRQFYIENNMHLGFIIDYEVTILLYYQLSD